MSRSLLGFNCVQGSRTVGRIYKSAHRSFMCKPVTRQP